MTEKKQYKNTATLKAELKDKANQFKTNQKASLNKDFSFKMGYDGFNSEMLQNPFIKKVSIDNTKDKENVSVSVYRACVLGWLSDNYESDLNTIQNDLVIELGTDGIKAFNGYINAKMEQHKSDILGYIIKA